ncbi:MAG: FAD-dependent oxidoreductase [Burkholderiaceae bacterium]|jgi:pyridine nucleotide-disulfide oxidoreductase family protein|nr:FAD-dependent oxidoreductase [Burkholderiaceae bacterium]
MKRLVLVGGGHAHVHVLAAMAREPMPGVHAVLVTPFARQVYSGMVPGFIAGHYGIDECAIPLEPMARAAQVELALATATAIDAAQRTVTLSDGRVAEYDMLSIDVGATQDRGLIAGARERGLFIRPIEHFVKLFDGVIELARARVLDVVVVGGGAAGFEVAMALQHRLGGDDGSRVRVCLVTGDASVLPGFPAATRQRALDRLRRARITVINQRCVEVGDTHLLLDNGARVVCDVPVMALPASAPAWLQGSGLALDERGFVATGTTLQSTSHPQVFAAGDVASRQDHAVPRSGVYAVRAGPALALNLRRALAGGQLLPWRAQERSLYLLSCGERRAIAAWGDWSAQGRWAWLWKDWIDRRFIRAFSTPPQPKR